MKKYIISLMMISMNLHAEDSNIINVDMGSVYQIAIREVCINGLSFLIGKGIESMGMVQIYSPTNSSIPPQPKTCK